LIAEIENPTSELPEAARASLKAMAQMLRALAIEIAVLDSAVAKLVLLPFDEGLHVGRRAADAEAICEAAQRPTMRPRSPGLPAHPDHQTASACR